MGIHEGYRGYGKSFIVFSPPGGGLETCFDRPYTIETRLEKRGIDESSVLVRYDDVNDLAVERLLRMIWALETGETLDLSDALAEAPVQ